MLELEISNWKVLSNNSMNLKCKLEKRIKWRTVWITQPKLLRAHFKEVYIIEETTSKITSFNKVGLCAYTLELENRLGFLIAQRKRTSKKLKLNDKLKSGKPFFRKLIYKS